MKTDSSSRLAMAFHARRAGGTASLLTVAAVAAAVGGCASEPKEDDRTYDVVVSEGPDLQPQKAQAVMNCWTGVCTCTDLEYSVCVSMCDYLWDTNCSKPAPQQPGQP